MHKTLTNLIDIKKEINLKKIHLMKSTLLL